MEGWVSANYGQMEPAPAVVYTATTPLPVRVMTLLWPAENVDELPRVEVLHDAQSRPAGLRLHDRGETVMFDDGEPEIEHHS